MGKADISSKRNIHIYARAWAEWVLHQRQIEIEAELSGEFQFIARATDSLLRVRKNGTRFLALTELQAYFDPKMPLRLSAYAALAREKYELDSYVTVVYFLPPPSGTPLINAYHSEFMGQVAHQDFQVIAIWELPADEALSLQNPALLPFVPLMKGGATLETLQQCANFIRQQPGAAELEVLLATFASMVMDAELVKRILRWDMQILKESPIYQELLEEGRKLGREEGREEGREAALGLLRRFLAYRFNNAIDHFDEQLHNLDLEAIKQLSDVVFEAETLAEFEVALARFQDKVE